MALPFPWVRELLAEQRLRLPRERLVETRLGDQGAQRHIGSGNRACGCQVFERSRIRLEERQGGIGVCVAHQGDEQRKERANPFGVPRVGHSVDRRTLLHLGETFQEDKVKLDVFCLWMQTSVSLWLRQIWKSCEQRRD